MNYFELYPGDYLRDTMRLSLTEHGAFVKLLFAYYAEEEALPADFDELFTIAGAVKTADKMAVKKVAEKYFPVGPDGLRHNGRADEEIVKASSRMESKTSTKSSEAERQQRYRNRRKAMFEALASVGIVPDFNISMDDLADLVTKNVTPRNVTNRNERNAVTGVTHGYQTPDPSNYVGNTEASAQVATGNDVTPEARACLLMRQAGCVQVNASHPDLRAAIAEGVTPEALAHTAAEALTAGKAKPFAWAIATARSRHAEGPQQITTNTGPPSRNSNGTSPMSKTLQALHELEAVKNGTGLDRSRDQLRIAEADPAQP